MSLQYLVDFDLNKLPIRQTDVLIIGGGIAGLTVAIIASERLKVKVVAKSGIKKTSTWRAQGGIAASLAPDDSPDLHYKDTVEAGAGLCDPKAVKVLVEEAAGAVSMLVDLGAKFDRDNGLLQFSREGGHTVSRVIHSGDATGSAIIASLVNASAQKKNIDFVENVFILDLLVKDDRCFGALAYERETGQMVAYLAQAVVLAAGGIGQVYNVTTNPVAATGDGLAIAGRRGVKLAGLEFVQFHPTALATEENPRFLVSETVRGEGAYLIDANGKRFLSDHHKLAELAPRDIVSQAVVKAMKETGADHVYLDARHIKASRLKTRFPAIWAQCLSVELDMSKDLIPVVPAAHYLIGGVVTDLYGRSSLNRLFAGGEVASTGVHGANRLASNSLLEGLVFSRRIGTLLLDMIETEARSGKEIKSLQVKRKRSKGHSLVSVRAGLREIMSDKVGVIRTNTGLREAAEWISSVTPLVDYEYDHPDDWETVNMITVAGLIVSSALAREQSLGVHLVGS